LNKKAEVAAEIKSSPFSFFLISTHPEMPDGYQQVSRSEMRDFVQDQGKQGLARRRTGVRRTSKAAVWHRDWAKEPFPDEN
jgi:hypothetical protein